MADLAIRVDRLGKRYRIGRRGELLGARLTRWAGDRSGAAPAEDLLWALKDVSLEIKQGEVVGLIGPNGAGKTTLLKILARITEATEGFAQIRGRLGSLLEVGTGFHPELTGRENIYLNGTILGMKKAEIQRNFDGIVAFSGVEKFIDTPVKHYSSGMAVRLAFAVAAHLEPEILLVDEVLAVGDAAFQAKSLGKIQQVARDGRTVLFVSHNMASISGLCSRACLLAAGRVVADGHPSTVIQEYLASIKAADRRVPLRERTDRDGSGIVRLIDLELLNRHGDVVKTVAAGDDLRIAIRYRAIEGGAQLENVKVGVGIYTLMGAFHLYCSNELVGPSFRRLPPEGTVTCTLPRLPLTPGQYPLNVSCLVNGVMADWVKNVDVIDVVEGDFFGTGRLPPATHGGFLAQQYWDADGVEPAHDGPALLEAGAATPLAGGRRLEAGAASDGSAP